MRNHKHGIITTLYVRTSWNFPSHFKLSASFDRPNTCNEIYCTGTLLMVKINFIWKSNRSDFGHSVYCIQSGKISSRFIFALWPEGEFKTGLIELHIKYHVRKLEVNSRLGESVSDLYRAKIRLGEFKAVYSNRLSNTYCCPLFALWLAPNSPFFISII